MSALITPITDIAPTAMSAAELVDAAARERVLVLGPFPPEGRDLDLVTRRAARDDIVAALGADGFLPRGPGLSPPRRWVEQWVKFGGGTAYAVDIHSAERWGVPNEEVAALFDEGLPIDGMARLVRCAPHHVLLLTARRLARR